MGDQVLLSCKKTRQDAYYRMETELVTVSTSDFRLNPNVAYKPVIYLYPQQRTSVSVHLKLDGKLTCTYPEYAGGWQVTAMPDGTLTDETGMQYRYLYWEGEIHTQWDFSAGFCVPGNETAAFLEDVLAQLGLNRQEANEFIVYWLPRMQENPYNLIAFQTDAYTTAAELKIEPEPDTVIRVFMTWQASDTAVSLPAQCFDTPERNGFVAIEWGGAECGNGDDID